ncbi:hypothetical protein AAZX31_07G233300 [Glycine max]|uniref:F-box domain-containing protein n=2 Tax=Glycine subgen. Soja TaxID=1462606 RepID=C6TCL9_SOYBN|nr:uncharacterized protein LOC100793622 [Glycine max]XP_028241733.1 uncharacterized protein LOC114420080 [Glycine soja]ACU19571.1 unknown [Glycine max]KAG5011166.1 hypothetical protein JHK87_019681 [Glycine soja]KAG5038978.1 hypothetical protein JHK86_019818 [Glycine max]KAG5144105.1 hypothetical protein JHK82_019800 [Glycine max]KAH1088530.1 hypothetical protein GYH30_019531 [Glycine max]|eukprot:NP_001239747.1 uncharacterized protein LOC100793622 [Glycine max]
MQKGKADSVSILSSLPEDVALKIASLLQVRDLCALGCCSRFWRELCFSDCIWESLVRNRWPLLSSFHFPSSSTHSPNFKKWRKLYLERQVELGLRARSVVKFLEACSRSESLEVGDYLKAVDTLIGTMFGFEDVQRFLFNPQMNVLINLVGLHYCLTTLGIPGDNLVEALRTHEISDRRVCIKWWKVGRWYYGFRMRDESHSRWVSLADLATEDDEHVLGVLRRGTVHEVLRVQISVVGRPSTPWSCQITQRLE